MMGAERERDVRGRQIDLFVCMCVCVCVCMCVCVCVYACLHVCAKECEGSRESYVMKLGCVFFIFCNVSYIYSGLSLTRVSQIIEGFSALEMHLLLC